MTIGRFTLLTDGSSDRVLLPILRWLIEQNSAIPFNGEWVDPRLRRTSPQGLVQRIRWAIDVCPCDLLFVHRDAEREPREKRVKEILGASEAAGEIPVVCVVPVRMTEAWLLFDEEKLRLAAGCPAGKMTLDMPRFDLIEREPDPKGVLHDLLRRASGLTGRRVRDFPERVHAHRLADLLDDFSPLRRLTAFNALEKDVQQALRKLDVARR